MIKRKFANNFKNPRVWIGLALFALILMITKILVFNAYMLYYHGDLKPRHHRGVNGQDKQFDPEQIKNWMTFDYLNVVFHLPPDYLKSELNIQDNRYPKIQISAYAKAKNLNQDKFIRTVIDSIKAKLQSRS